MIQLCIYGAAALFCFILYLSLTRETYFSGKKAYRTDGFVRIVMPGSSGWQFLLEYHSPDGLKHSGLSPFYEASMPDVRAGATETLPEDSASGAGRSPLGPDTHVDITVRPFRFGPIRVDALRIDDRRLIKKADYRPLIGLGCIFVLMGIIRAVAMFLL